jgi:hypothetical protein
VFVDLGSFLAGAHELCANAPAPRRRRHSQVGEDGSQLRCVGTLPPVLKPYSLRSRWDGSGSGSGGGGGVGSGGGGGSGGGSGSGEAVAVQMARALFEHVRWRACSW